MYRYRHFEYQYHGTQARYHGILLHGFPRQQRRWTWQGAVPRRRMLDNLAELPSIDDHVVMETLKARHEADLIYTKNGAVLV